MNGYKDPLLRTKKALAKSLGISVKRLHQYLRLVSFQGAKDKPNRVLQVKRATRH